VGKKQASVVESPEKINRQAAEKTADLLKPENAAPHKADPAREKAAIEENDAYDVKKALSHVPDPGLTEVTVKGEIPKVGEDGRQVWQVYARPFDRMDPRPRISIVVMGLGLSRVASDAALQRLPAPVTLVFDVESPTVGAWLARARQDGHETLLDIPMEPFDYPSSDPGPNTLLTALPNSDNIERFLWALRQGVGYIGVTTETGSRFTVTPAKVKPLIDVFRERGLLFFDARVTSHSVMKDLAETQQVPFVMASRRIDDNPTPAAIDAALSDLEQTARLQGRAIGVVSPLPLTLDRLDLWIKDLAARGFALAPLSAQVGG